MARTPLKNQEYVMGQDTKEETSVSTSTFNKIIMSAVATLLVGFITGGIVLYARQTEIRGNRFTDKEGERHMVMITENRKDVAALQDDITDIKLDQREMKADQKETLRLLHEIKRDNN